VGAIAHSEIVKKDSNQREEQWDEVPAKVVGRRRAPTDGWSSMDALQSQVNQLGRGYAAWPKGVYRFRSFEEADGWWIQKMVFRER
jgi:hypothetical protein